MYILIRNNLTIFFVSFQVPKVRFGKTELQMPIATLGCMRFQQVIKNSTFFV